MKEKWAGDYDWELVRYFLLPKFLSSVWRNWYTLKGLVLRLYRKHILKQVEDYKYYYPLICEGMGCNECSYKRFWRTRAEKMMAEHPGDYNPENPTSFQELLRNSGFLRDAAIAMGSIPNFGGRSDTLLFVPHRVFCHKCLSRIHIP